MCACCKKALATAVRWPYLLFCRVGKPGNNQGVNKMATKRNNATAAAAAAAVPVPVLGKYAGAYNRTGTAPVGVPPSAANAAMLGAYYYVGAHAPQRATTVMGIIAAHVAANPGITGAALVAAMQGPLAPALARTGATKYASNGAPCGAWCAGYVRGAASARHGHIATGPAPKAQAAA